MQQPVTDKTSLLIQLSSNKSTIKAFGVKQLRLFGSFATGKANNQSDVDLLVDFERGRKTHDNFMELSFYLEDILGRKVELVTPQSLSKFLAPHILKQAENVAI